MRRLRGACLCLLAGLAASEPAWAQEGDSASGRLSIQLTTDPSLSKDARAAMMSEAAAIWRQQGIDIEWLPPAAVHSPARDRLRVLVVTNRPLSDSPDAAIAVGELVRAPNNHPLAILSIRSAQRLVSSVRGRAGYELIAVDARRLGIVLGRALAHEIGHFLLDTHTHAESGLMRPHFSALEFTDTRDGVFALDRAASAWLRARDAGRFSYAGRSGF